MASLLKSITNKFYNSDAGRVLLDNENSYAQTPYGTEFIPEYVTTTGQKRFSTEAAIPNLPKPETLYFVHFSLNPRTQDIINKKKSLINYLVSGSATDVNNSSSAIANLTAGIKKSIDNLKEQFNTKYSSGLTALGGLFNKSKKTTTVTNRYEESIPNDENSQSYGDYMPEGYILNQLSFELSKFVKSIDKPTINFTVNEHNEYNRKRLVYDKMDFGELKVSFWDVKENPVERFLMAYLKIISNDFLCKSFADFRRQIVTREFDRKPNDWGFDLDSNFRLIEKISVVEYYMDKMMVYTYENPVITSISFGTNKMGSWNPSEINVTFKYEGFTNDLLDITPYNTAWYDEGNSESKTYLKSMVNANITDKMANFMNVRYKSGVSMGVDTAVSFIKGVLDAPKEERWATIKEQSLDTLRKLGFSDEINLVKGLQDDYDNYKSAPNKGKYLLKMTDDPSSFLGEVLNNGSTSSASGLLKMFS